MLKGVFVHWEAERVSRTKKKKKRFANLPVSSSPAGLLLVKEDKTGVQS